MNCATGICYERGGDGDSELVRPCACSGSMEWVHKGCLLRWLTSSPVVVSRGCDVCDSPWREDLVKKPSLRLFVADLLLGARGELAFRRFLRHVSNIPRFSDDHAEHEAVFGGDDDDVVEEDQIVPRHDNNENGGVFGGLDDAWEAIGLLAPAGGGVEELNAAAAAITRLALWSLAMCVAVAQGRASLQLFAYGVRCVLVLDSRVDALLLPGSVADYLEVVFPGLPCLQRAARFVRDERSADAASARSPARWRAVFGLVLRRSARRGPNASHHKRDGLFARLAAWGRGLAAPTKEGERSRPSLAAFVFGRLLGRAGGARPSLSDARRGYLGLFWSVACRVAALARGPWRVDDVFVGFVALALDVRGLARFASGTRFFHRHHHSLGKQAVVALARVATSPEAVAHDVATVFEHLVSSPLLVVHWLCVFPSYVYALRLALARIGLLSAEDQILDLENGEGVAFHLSLLALAASATTCVAALAHALHSEYVECVFCSFVVPHSLAFAQLDCRPLPRLVARRGLLKTPSFSS